MFVVLPPAQQHAYPRAQFMAGLLFLNVSPQTLKVIPFKEAQRRNAPAQTLIQSFRNIIQSHMVSATNKRSTAVFRFNATLIF